MIIGVPKERKQGERRVAITPDGVKQLCCSGHQVLLETGAGLLSGFTDQEYLASGAQLVSDLESVWRSAEMLVKVKEPSPEELPFFRKGLIVFSFLHPAVAPEMTRAMIDSGVLGLDYDLVTDRSGRLSILEPMSIVAGKLAVQCGASALQADQNGAGILLGGAVGVAPAKVVVLGAGAAGRSAAEVAIGMGAEVSVFDINPDKLRHFSSGHYRCRTLHSSPAAIEREVILADLVIGSVLIPGALAPKLITKKMVEKMHHGSVIVDICIDQGGCAETSKPTSISSPTYSVCGVIHYCVPNMPALVPRTSTWALTNATLPWIVKLANRGVEDLIRTEPSISSAVVTYNNNLTNREIGEALGLSYAEIDQLL